MVIVLWRKQKMEVSGEILVVPFFGQGHLFPCIELCKRLSSDHNCKATLIIPSHLSSSVPSNLCNYPLIEIVELPNSPASPPQEMPAPAPSLALDALAGPGPHPFQRHHQRMGNGLEAYLSERCKDPATVELPVCAVLDVMMSWSKEFFLQFGIRTVSFFTSGASSAAMQYASWKHRAAEEMKPGEVWRFPGLPEEMELSYADLQREHRYRRQKQQLNNDPNNHPHMGGPNAKLGHPELGDKPRWLDEIEGSTGLLFNTSEGLELPYLNYIAAQINKPVYGIGPLLPDHYWKSTDSILHDGQIRSNKESDYTEGQVMQWLNSKPRRSVIYVSFGSEVGPSLEEYEELANALEKSKRPFIWVIQLNAGRPGPPPGLTGENFGSVTKEEGYYPHNWKEKIGDRGLIVRGWAPQLLILSHTSIGGFLSHCGWNSTVESVGKGVAILAWPIRGDQFHNAKLIVSHLRVGRTLWKHEDDPAQKVKKQNIQSGIGLLLDDKDVAKRAEELSHRLMNGFPSSSAAALDSFVQGFRP